VNITTGKGDIRVAIVGVGNCANSLVQGVEYYKDAAIDQEIPGLMHAVVGGYHISSVKFVAAFDVDAKKVGLDLADAIWASENNTIKFSNVAKTGVPVLRGVTNDGLGKYYKETIKESDAPAVDVVNALPVFIASDPVWEKKFADAGLPIVGDDIKSQVGATITHRIMAKLFQDRGVHLDRTYQLNVGGNMDFKNMLERDRLESKKISKTNSVTSQLDHDLGEKNVHIGPSDYIPWLDDRKWAYVRLEGRAFGDVPLNLEYKLEVWDSPNSAGVIIDALRCAKIGLDRKIGGALLSPSSYFMKTPPTQYTDEAAHNKVEDFIAGKLDR
jgi:myo-inositol-1-phosphate synthase